MAFKNFFISIIKSLMILLLATLIFSTITLDFPNLIKGVFGDIFEYASPDAQKQVVVKLAETCSSLDQGQDVVAISQLCTNKSMLDSMKENCDNYRAFKEKGVKVDNEEQLESGEIERSCDELNGKSSLLPDFSKIGALCKDYKAGKINDKEFFFGVIGSPFEGQQTELPNVGVFKNYYQTINYLNNNKIIYFIVLSILAAILYLLIRDTRLFLVTLSGISLSLGILIMLPYFAILAYDKFIGIDTTSLLGIFFQNTIGFDPKAILSVVLLMLLRTYNNFIITLGIIFLGLGVAGKSYSRKLKRQSEVIETKAEKKTEKEKKAKVNKEQTKEEIEEAYKHRDRSAKEILEELEEIHKKKSKKD